MSLRDIIERDLSNWMKGKGPAQDVVLSTRVRLARNLDRIPFPNMASDADLRNVLGKVEAAVKGASDLKNLKVMRLAELPPEERQVFVEKHLMSPQHTREVKFKGLILNPEESISIMVNEEDHLRIQSVLPGLQAREAWELASRVDDALEAKLEYAFDERIGYLTTCPTNAGTGLRVSVMVHLPALGVINQVGKVLSGVSHMGMAVRGLYGEGTEAQGNIYQISNQVTLGRSEQDIIENLQAVTSQVIDQERGARNYLLKENKETLADRAYRAYGILGNARLMTSEEALRLLSDVKLGVEAGVLDRVDPRIFAELMVLTRPAYLEKLMGRQLSHFERDINRAALIRERIQLGET